MNALIVRLIISGLIAGAGIALLGKQKKKVFISYDHSEDVNLRNLLEAWNKNSKFEFTFERTSPFQKIDSDDEAVVKRALTPMLKKAEYLLVVVGKETENSQFVLWEIERAMDPDVNLKIAAVKRNRRCRLPKPLRGRASVADKFSVDGVLHALAGAKRVH